jgi:hypothetical protein
MNKQNYAYLLHYLFPDNDYVGEVTDKIVSLLDDMVHDVNERDFVRVRWGLGYFKTHVLREMEGIFSVTKQTIHRNLTKSYIYLRHSSVRKELHEHMISIGCNLNWKDVW